MHRIFFVAVAFLAFHGLAQAGSVTISPEAISQGEPALIAVLGVAPKDVSRLTFAGKPVPLFLWKGNPTALIGVDLLARTGVAEVRVVTKSGGKLLRPVRILQRKKVTAPMGIPDKMGGNTVAGQNNLVHALVNENQLLAGIKGVEAPYFEDVFRYPLEEVKVTDDFGYSRKTGVYSINHRGTDFRAAIGTPLYALNDGVVRFAGSFMAYGKTVIIDHGARVTSHYLHLSKMNVREGELVKKGALVGLSGDTGYALTPHLHLSIKINGISVDPMKFFALLGPKP